jgi:hypothetical protein
MNGLRRLSLLILQPYHRAAEDWPVEVGESAVPLR